MTKLDSCNLMEPTMFFMFYGGIMARNLLMATLLLLCAAVFALSSTTNSAPFTLDTVDPDITIIAPNGGEEWYIGDTNNILWEITESNPVPNSVNIWYNRGGLDNTPIAMGIEDSGTLAWPMPDTLGTSYRIRIAATDTFGNSSLKRSAGNFTITYVPPAPPQGVTVDISSAVDAIITWQPVTQTIYGSPIVPDGYIVLYNETPYEDSDNLYYYLWDVTNGTTFTHGGVARRRAQMYYRVVAYKDIDGRMAELLISAKAYPDQKLSFAEIKQAMSNTTRGVK
ncbi:MAG: hypothetical protein PHT77_12640 [Bacteroidales bacterium]|nr:hypothetical protein [Bacteroidales bacterium]MDD3962695.1 hypothetical protein [Bacteroidales bacterium]